MNIDSLLYPAPPPSYKRTHSNYYSHPVPHLYFSSRKDSSTIIFYHGNGSDCGLMQSWTNVFVDNGYNVMSIEYPGYGPYKGTPDSDHILSDVNKLARYLRTLPAGGGTIHVMGQSIGTGPASELAKYIVNLASLTLITPYISISTLAHDYLPVFGYYLARDSYTTLDNAKTVLKRRSPVYIHHGTQDELIGYHHALEFLCMGCTLFAYENMDHNSILSVATEHILKALTT